MSTADLTPFILLDPESAVRHEIQARDLAHARELAVAWARAGDWDTSRGTLWLDVTILDEDGEHVDAVRSIQLDPPAPKCSGGEHDWQSPHEIVGGLLENPGVRGHVGGVIITQVCMHCGCARITDTWAQRPDTGEQGLESVEYEVGRYADEIAALKAADEDNADDATAMLEVSPIGNGTHVMISRQREAGDDGPEAYGTGTYDLPRPTADGLTHTRADGWQTNRGISAIVFVEREAPALARHLEQAADAARHEIPQAAVSDEARIEWEKLAAEFPALHPIE